MRKFKLYTIIIVAAIVLPILAAVAKDQLLPMSTQTLHPAIRVIYLVKEQGELDRNELDSHPEVVVTESFDTFKEYAKWKVALWIDKDAARELTDGDKSWFKWPPQKYYPVVLVGYGDKDYSFRIALWLCCPPGSLGGIGIGKPAPGFSVYQNEPDPENLVEFWRGYATDKPHVEDILNITNALLDGTLPADTLTLPPVATPTLPF